MKPDEIFAETVKQWGVDAQVCMAIEEMAELTKALLKMKRNNYTWAVGSQLWENLAEEVADVELMLEQIKYMFEIYRTRERKSQKLERLERLLSPTVKG